VEKIRKGHGEGEYKTGRPVKTEPRKGKRENVTERAFKKIRMKGNGKQE